MSFDQREHDLKYVVKTLNESRAAIVKASKQAKAMGLDYSIIDAAGAMAGLAIVKINQNNRGKQ